MFFCLSQPNILKRSVHMQVHSVSCCSHKCTPARLHYWFVAKFLVPDWGYIVDSGIGLSYNPARLHRMAGLFDNPKQESTISSSRGLGIWPLFSYLCGKRSPVVSCTPCTPPDPLASK
jgi:hypothetical protein